MGCGHDPFAADKGSTTDVGVVPRVVRVGNLKRYLDQKTTYFTPKPCHASAEMLCVALDRGNCPFLTVFTSIRLFSSIRCQHYLPLPAVWLGLMASNYSPRQLIFLKIIPEGTSRDCP